MITMLTRLLPFAAFVAAGLMVVTAVDHSIDIKFPDSTGAYEIVVDGATWFHSADTFFTSNNVTYGTMSGQPLTLKNVSQSSGRDAMGSYIKYTWEFTTDLFVATAKVYSEHIVFQQIFPSGVSSSAIGSSRDSISSSFPSITIENTTEPRGYASFQGDMCGSGSHAGGFDPESDGIGTGVHGGPLVVYNQDLTSSVVISAHSNFMAHNAHLFTTLAGKSATWLGYGLMGTVETIPKGYVLETVISVSEGVNKAMDHWGDILLATYGKERYNYQNDWALNQLGYSTDNGAYYYYQTEPNKNYEDTLLDVSDYSQSVKIPYKYILLDSWWYYKGPKAGVTVWDARPDVFPNGLENFYNKTNWPTQLHNRFWSPETNYSKTNGGDWDFIIEDRYALPLEEEFWVYLFSEKKKTGMIMYEQDWLDTEFDGLEAFGKSATLGRQWMLQMGRAAERTGVTIQACMSHVRHILQGIEMPALTNARASGDYHPGNNQWNVGFSSILAHATGIAPSKDNYWSTPVQADTHYGNKTSEPYNRMQAAVITMTTGPVAPSDKVGGSDVELIMRSCTSHGTLLQPSRPATRMDSTFIRDSFGTGAPKGELWSTHTKLDGYFFSYILAINMEGDHVVATTELGYDPTDKLLAFEANTTTTLMNLDSSTGLPVKACGSYDFQSFTVSPVLENGWTLLGEPNKWVSVSTYRFSKLDAYTGLDGAEVSVLVDGFPGEVVMVNFADPSGKVVATQCSIPPSSSANLVVNAKGFSCN